MEDDAVAGYGIVTMLADAVGAVGDDPAAISEYMPDQQLQPAGVRVHDVVDRVGRDGERTTDILRR
jgi:hypothetical protein